MKNVLEALESDMYKLNFKGHAGITLFTMISTNSPRQLHILWHNRDSLSMHSTQIAIFKKSN